METGSASRGLGTHLLRRRHPVRPRSGAAAVPEPACPAPSRRSPILLADLTSPWAYLAHLRLRGAGEVQVRHPVWWAVCDAPSVPLTGSRDEGAVRERRRAELEAVRVLAAPEEEVPDDVPAVVPHPRPVAAAFAEAVDLGRGAEVLNLLLEAYWWEGRDIGNPEVLRRLLPSVLVDERALCTGDPRREWGYVVTPAREPLSDQAYHLLGRWQGRWVELGRPGPLTLLDEEGTQVRAGALAMLSGVRSGAG